MASNRSERDRLFAKAADAYEHRGFATHDAQHPESAFAFDTFDLARRFFIACLERNTIPSSEALLLAWKTGMPVGPNGGPP